MSSLAGSVFLRQVVIAQPDLELTVYPRQALNLLLDSCVFLSLRELAAQQVGTLEMPCVSLSSGAAADSLGKEGHCSSAGTPPVPCPLGDTVTRCSCPVCVYTFGSEFYSWQCLVPRMLLPLAGAGAGVFTHPEPVHPTTVTHEPHVMSNNAEQLRHACIPFPCHRFLPHHGSLPVPPVSFS